jgi:hypothetical protein
MELVKVRKRQGMICKINASATFEEQVKIIQLVFF